MIRTQKYDGPATFGSSAGPSSESTALTVADSADSVGEGHTVSPTIDDFRQAVLASGLRGYSRTALLLYADHFDRDCPGSGYTFVTRERLMAWLGCHRDTVVRVMRQARQDGWLMPIPGAGAHRNHAPRYHLAVPGVGVVVPASKPERVAKMDTLPNGKGVHHAHPFSAGKGVQKGRQKGVQKGVHHAHPIVTNDVTTNDSGGAVGQSSAATSTRAMRPVTDHEQDDAAMALAVAFLARLPDGAQLTTVHPRAMTAFRGLAAAGWTADQLVAALDADPGINPHRCRGGLIVQWLEAQCQRPAPSSYRQPPLVMAVPAPNPPPEPRSVATRAQLEAVKQAHPGEDFVRQRHERRLREARR